MMLGAQTDQTPATRLYISVHAKAEGMDDRALALALANRQPAAAQQLLDSHYASLYRFAFHLTRRAEDSEDIVQQTLLRVLTGIGRYDGRVALRTWLLAILYHASF